MNENRRQVLLWTHENLKQAFIVIMRQYAIWTPLPVVPVGGYPKSGTTWVSKMVARYMDLPHIMAANLAVGFRYVVHHHWSYHPGLDRSIQVVRDGRDVMVSLYMNLMKRYTETRRAMSTLDDLSPGKFLRTQIGLSARRRRLYSRMFGLDFDPWDIRSNLPAFIERELQKPFFPAAREPWPVHVRSWLRGKRTVIVRYEDLLEDGPSALGRVLSAYLGEPVDESRVREAYARYHFRNVTGRRPGEEDRASFARKGVAGDWKNHFTPDACDIFMRHAGDLLVELGYEHDDSWVDGYS